MQRILQNQAQVILKPKAEFNIKDDNKKQFCNMVCELDKDVLISINYLIKDVLEKLKLIKLDP